MSDSDLTLPFARTWWIEPGRVLGGRYPGTRDPRESEAMLARLLDAGIRLFVNLQEPGELGQGGAPFHDYANDVARLAATRGIDVRVVRAPIRDMGVADDATMRRALAALSTLAAGERAYVHCWGGHGRTGTVAACHLIAGGLDAPAAFARIAAARAHDAHLTDYESPQTPGQRAFAAAWRG